MSVAATAACGGPSGDQPTTGGISAGGDVATAHPPAAAPGPTRSAPRAADQGSAPVDSLGNPAPAEPDPALTPGDTLPVTAQDVCTPGYSHKVRNVPVEVKRAVYARYGVVSHQPREYEVDHLISLELGGSNSIRNLWPESYWTSPWNAHVKDALENALHREVCAGRLDLATAQRAIASDWINAYERYVKRAPARARSRRRRAADRTGAS